jgi:hypothetical protein
MPFLLPNLPPAQSSRTRRRPRLWRAGRAEWLREHVLEDIPHRQVVFSLPKALRPLFLRERPLLRELPKCAWRVVQAYFHTAFQRKVTPGMVIAIQTFGTASLGWNPHLHTLASEGGWSEDGVFEPLSLFDDETLAELFRHEVFKMLLACPEPVEGPMSASLSPPSRS